MPATTPHHSHRWQFDLGNTVAYGGTAIATNRALLRALVNGLLAIPGVSVYRSCDAASAGADGDGVNRWDSDTDLVVEELHAGEHLVERGPRGPGVAAVVALEEPAAGPAAGQLPGAARRLPEGGIFLSATRWLCAECWLKFLQGRRSVKEAA